jgi:nicotinamidase-related amidase
VHIIRRDQTVLAIVDIQERLLGALADDRRNAVEARALVALDAALALQVPVLVSEQYPKGLGPTIGSIRERLGDSFAPVEKLAFSCGRSDEFTATLAATGRRDVILCGVETHVCVLQTMLDLDRAGYRVFVAADAVASRRDFDRDMALALMREAGATVGTTEMFAFQLLERAGTAEFKAISKIVR